VARVFIHYDNFRLIEEHRIVESALLINRIMLREDAHHELMHYEGLLALTNISALSNDLREK